jgi:hypothetical protein
MISLYPISLPSSSPKSDELSSDLYPSDNSDSEKDIRAEESRLTRLVKIPRIPFKRIKEAFALYYSSHTPVQEIARKFGLSYPSLQAKINLVNACAEYLDQFISHGMHSSKTNAKIREVCTSQQFCYTHSKIKHLLKLNPDYNELVALKARLIEIL